MTHAWVGRGPHSWVGSGPHVWVPSEEDDLGGEEEEVCAFGWLKLCPIEADGRFVMRAHEGLVKEVIATEVIRSSLSLIHLRHAEI